MAITGLGRLDEIEANWQTALSAAQAETRAQFDQERQGLSDALSVLDAQFQRAQGQVARERDQLLRGVQSDALQRGVLRSGITAENRAQTMTTVADALAALNEQTAQQRGQLTAQQGTLDARLEAALAGVQSDYDMQFLSIVQALRDLGLLGDEAIAAEGTTPGSVLPPQGGSQSGGSSPSGGQGGTGQPSGGSDTVLGPATEVTNPAPRPPVVSDQGAIGTPMSLAPSQALAILGRR